MIAKKKKKNHLQPFIAISKKRAAAKAVKAVEFIALTFGYVETAKVSNLIFKCELDELPTTEKEALEDLAGALFDKFMFYWRNRRQYQGSQACCKPDQQLGKNYCSHCGRNLNHDIPYSTDFEDYLWELCDATTSDFGDDVVGWNPWCSVFEVKDSPNLLLDIPERAEEKILAALNCENVEERNRPTLESWKEDLARFRDDDDEEEF